MAYDIDRAVSLRYGGFWIRFMAAVADSIIVNIAFGILNPIVFGGRYFDFGTMYVLDNTWLGFILQAGYYIVMWYLFGATLGKMLFRLRIVSADTLGDISLGQAIGRYLSLFISAFPLMLGFIWAGFDPRKQAWHDKLAGTFVLADTRSYARREAS